MCGVTTHHASLAQLVRRKRRGPRAPALSLKHCHPSQYYLCAVIHRIHLRSLQIMPVWFRYLRSSIDRSPCPTCGIEGPSYQQKSRSSPSLCDMTRALLRFEGQRRRNLSALCALRSATFPTRNLFPGIKFTIAGIWLSSFGQVYHEAPALADGYAAMYGA